MRTDCRGLALHGSTSPVRGKVNDISSGGLSLTSSHPLKPFTLMRYEINISNLPVAIPVLTDVRWIEKDQSGFNVSVSLQR